MLTVGNWKRKSSNVILTVKKWRMKQNPLQYQLKGASLMFLLCLNHSRNHRYAQIKEG